MQVQFNKSRKIWAEHFFIKSPLWKVLSLMDTGWDHHITHAKPQPELHSHVHGSTAFIQGTVFWWLHFVDRNDFTKHLSVVTPRWIYVHSQSASSYITNVKNWKPCCKKWHQYTARFDIFHNTFAKCSRLISSNKHKSCKFGAWLCHWCTLSNFSKSFKRECWAIL